MGKLNLHYVPFVSHLKKHQFISSPVVHFHKIFGHRLEHSSRINIIYLLSRHRMLFLIIYFSNLQTLYISARNSESLSFIGHKNYILETRMLREEIAQNYLHKKSTFFEIWQVLSNMLHDK